MNINPILKFKRMLKSNLNRVKVPLLLIGLLSQSMLSHSLPLLAENESTSIKDLLVLYPDHRDKNKFYYFPGSAVIAEDDYGIPKFTFGYYGIDPDSSLVEAGGFLSFTSAIKHTRGQLKALKKFQEDNPNAKLSVLPVKKSYLTMGESTSKKNQPQVFANLFEDTALPPFAGNPDQYFGLNASLTKIGAMFMRATLKKTNNNFNLYYCYQTQGLGPDFDALITIHWHQVYSHYRAAARVRKWWSSAQITREVENLRTNGSVKIEINGGTAQDEEYVKEVARQITARVFESKLQNVPGKTPEMGKLRISSFQFNYTKKIQKNVEKWDIKRRRLETRDRCIPMGVSGVQRHYKDCVTRID